MFFQCINICQVPWEALKTAAFGLGFQHLPQDLANVNAWRTMFDPYIDLLKYHVCEYLIPLSDWAEVVEQKYNLIWYHYLYLYPGNVFLLSH